MRGPYVAEDIEVQPGDSNVIAAALKNLSVSPSHAGVAIFDNGVMRPNVTQRHTGANRIEFSNEPSLLYGSDTGSGLDFRKIAIDANGAVEISVTRDSSFRSVDDLEYDSGLIYMTNSVVLDPDLPSVIGAFPGASFAEG